MLPRSPWRARGTSLLVVAAVAVAGEGRCRSGSWPTRATSPGGRRVCSTATRWTSCRSALPRCRRASRRSKSEVVAAARAMTKAEQDVASAPEVVDDAQVPARRLPGGGRRLRVGALPGRRRPDAAAPSCCSGGDPGDVRRGDGLPGRRRRARRRGDRRRRDACGRPPLDAAAAGRRGARPGAGARRTRSPREVAELEAKAAAVTDELDAGAGRRGQAAGAAAAGAGRRQHADGGQLAGLRRPADRGRRRAAPGRGSCANPPAGLPGRAGAGRPPPAGARSAGAAQLPRQPDARCWCCRPRPSPR